MALIQKLEDHKYNYVVIVDDLKRALDLYDKGVRVAVGDIDDPETYRRLRVDQAALVVATNRDEINTNIAFTAREQSERVPIITTADLPYSEDILTMAGSTKVLKPFETLGHSLAAWTLGGDKSNIISRFDELIIAQFAAVGTPLVGKTLADSKLRERFGVTVVGLWDRGLSEMPRAESQIHNTSVLLLAGSEKTLAAFDEVYFFYHIFMLTSDPVLIIGSGRVGDTVAQEFRTQGRPYLVIEKDIRKLKDEEHYVAGDAADIRTLQKAWIEKAPAAILTTHDDATNIYLTKYLRSLRPDMQILSRANLDRNVSTLHRAGADFVMSYVSLGANAIFNFLKNEDMWMLAEGLNIFRRKVPKSLVGRTLASSGIRKTTECNVVAVKEAGVMSITPDPQTPLKQDTELILIGTNEAERKFLKNFES
jgi:Trk K+ transport system NAD-binding subunit